MKSIKIKSLYFDVLYCVALLPLAALGEEISDKSTLTTNHEYGDVLFMSYLLYVLIMWSYPINKWRLWKKGFDAGNAQFKEFLNALKWTAIATFLTLIPALIARELIQQ
jgi:hypothetical protein